MHRGISRRIGRGSITSIAHYEKDGKRRDGMGRERKALDRSLSLFNASTVIRLEANINMGIESTNINVDRELLNINMDIKGGKIMGKAVYIHIQN